MRVGKCRSECLHGDRDEREEAEERRPGRIRTIPPLQGTMDSEYPTSQPQMNFLASANATAGPKPPLREVQARF